MITFVILLCGGITYINIFESSRIKFASLMFMNVDIGDTPKNPWGDFRRKKFFGKNSNK